MQRESGRFGRRAVCGAVIGALAGSVYAQTDFSWRDPVSGVWSSSGAWSPVGIPGAGDNVFIGVTAETSYGVTLDVTNALVNNFSLTASLGTFNVNDLGFGIGANLTLSNGRIRGNGTAAGAVLVGGNAAMDNAVFGDMNLFAVLGNAEANNMTFQNIETWDVGPQSSLTLRNSSLVGVGMLNNSGDMFIDTGGSTLATIDDTCVGNGKNMSWSGNGTISLTGDSEIMNGDGGRFLVTDGGGRMEGDPKGGTQTFMNEGTVEQAVTGRFGARGSTATVFTGLEFVNEGQVLVGFGEMLFTNDTGVTDGKGGIDRGAWNVFGNSVLTFEEQSVERIVNGASVSISGEFSQFNGIATLSLIGGESAFSISNGYDFQTFDGFTNNGFLGVGQGSEFDAAEVGLSNFSNGLLAGGTYEVAGQLLLPGDTQIQFLEADVRLLGAASQLTGIDALEVVGSQGAFTIDDGRQFQTADDFVVLQGGRVRVGFNSMFDVNGQLVNFANGVFDDGFFEIQGTLRAPDLVIQTISNELILDGQSSQFIDEQGNDALAALTFIAQDGILRLRGGRSLTNLGSLVVDGVLEIDPVGGRFRTGGGPVDQLSTVGDFRVTGTGEVAMVLGGTEPGSFASILVGGDALLDGSPAGALLRLVIDGSYDPKAGDEFVLLRTDGQVLGRFGEFSVVGLGAGLGVEIEYLSQAIVARITPTPAGAALLGLGGLFAARRRR